MTCRRTVSLGAYLLGALDPAERSEFEDHIATCPTCKAELVRLAPLPGLLQRLSPEDYAAIENDDEFEVPDWPPDFPAEIELADIDLVADPPPEDPGPARPGWLRRQRVALAAAAAVVLLAMGGFVFLQEDESGPTTIQASPVAWTAVDPATGVHGRVELTKRGWGTELKLSMEDVPAGKKICHMIVYGRDGSQEIAGQWAAGAYSALRSAPGSTSIQLADIERIEVTAGGGLLVGIHPTG
ncbi:zf-HC2 domain-containing protein [Kibdelosporangium lantanae]